MKKNITFFVLQLSTISRMKTFIQMKMYQIFPGFLILFISIPVMAKEGGGKITVANTEVTLVKEIPATDVKNQDKTSTCWSFCTLSMLESELLRMGKEEVDLSEMYIVRHTYREKAERYIRMHGSINFGGGGASNDVTDILGAYGIVPEDVYQGTKPGKNKHEHDALDLELKEYVESLVKEEDHIDIHWYEKVDEIINAHLGEITDTFRYKNHTYTSQSYFESLGIVPEDYIMMTSFTHHPFYTNFILEVPDNWSWGRVYNVPLNELTQIVDSAIYHNYSVVWSSDVSEKGFNFKEGFALSIEADIEHMSEIQKKKWNRMNEAQKDKALYRFEVPYKKKDVTQELRQHAFDSYLTTDDHGMHIVGIGFDGENNKYYYVKNSWGKKNNLQGYLFASEEYFKYKTISVMLHKDAVPIEIAVKLGLK